MRHGGTCWVRRARCSPLVQPACTMKWRRALRSYEQWDPESDMWTHHLYGQLRPHIGAGHGFASNVHALRGFVGDDVLRARVARLLTRTARHEGGPGQLASVGPSMGRTGAENVASTVVPRRPREHRHAGRPDAAALAIAGGGKMTWRAGPLRKGPGLCHGTAGNGFSFLKLRELTGDPRWMHRGRRFAMHAVSQLAETGSITGAGATRCGPATSVRRLSEGLPRRRSEPSRSST